ncbi:SMI1/KNR4 family protein [Catellatospora sp. NPDC049609]|uniref:SMI1/KNR4 family protein n=1 Tax=Catellatospora sp. NPDC049609 TaxID=3155505 RepID=UPI003438C15D
MPFSSTLAAIDDWLAEHAPLTWRDLAPPATGSELGAVRAHLGVDLLPDVEALLRWHNGAGRHRPPYCLAPGYAFLGTADMIALARKRIAADEGRLLWRTWNPRWLPVAADGRGRCLAVDHAEDGRAEVTVSSEDDGDGAPKTWPDLGNLLSKTYEAMRYGSRLMGRRRVVTDGRLDWDDA